MPGTLLSGHALRLSACVWEKGAFVRSRRTRGVGPCVCCLLALLIITVACGGVPPASPASTTASLSAISTAVANTATTSTTTTTTGGTTGPLPVEHKAQLSWVPSPSLVDGYYVYRSSQAGGPYSRITNTPQVLTSYSDTGVSAGQTYFYVVTAVASNVESGYSNEMMALIPSP